MVQILFRMLCHGHMNEAQREAVNIPICRHEHMDRHWMFAHNVGYIGLCAEALNKHPSSLLV